MKALYLILTILLSLQFMCAQQVVIDARAVGQVGKNSAAATGVERLIKSSVEKARKAQETVNKYTLIVHANMARIEDARQNVEAFKQGTANLKVLNSYLLYCFQELGYLAEDIVKYPLGTVAYSSHINRITLEIFAIKAKIANAVTDGQAPIYMMSSNPITNWIDPVKRLELINLCIYELGRIFSFIRDIRSNIAMRNTMRNAAFALSPTAVLTKDMTEQVYKDIKRLWFD